MMSNKAPKSSSNNPDRRLTTPLIIDELGQNAAQENREQDRQWILAEYEALDAALASEDRLLKKKKAGKKTVQNLTTPLLIHELGEKAREKNRTQEQIWRMQGYEAILAVREDRAPRVITAANVSSIRHKRRSR